MLQKKFLTILNKLKYFRDYYIPNWKQIIYEVKQGIRKWKRTTIQQFFTLAIHFLAVFIAYTSTLALSYYLWFFFKETPVGLEYARINPSSFFVPIFLLLQKTNILYLSFLLTLDTLLNCFTIGLFVQFFPLRRYFYDYQGIFYHIGWFIVFSAITALNIMGSNYPLSFYHGIILYFFPVCFLLNACLKTSAKLVPEITLFFKLKGKIHEVVRIARIRNLNCKPDP